MVDFSLPMPASLRLRYRIDALRGDYCWLRVTRWRGELSQRRHDDPSRLAPLEDRLAMLLKGVQARLQSMKHRDGAIGLLSGLNQLVDDSFLPSNTLLGDRDVSLRPGQGSPAYRCRAWRKMP
jgi:hypothetical protein